MVNKEMNNIIPPLDSRKSLRDWTLSILHGYSIRPLKKLSQNFIVDPRLIKDILRLIKNKNKQVVEIGAGIGTITLHLALYTYVTAIEYDNRLVRILEDIILTYNSGLKLVDVVHGDVLKSLKIDHFNGIIVSNVPYHIASYIIILALRSLAQEIILVLQKELALRLIARPGTKDYGRLTVITNYITEPQLLKIYPPTCFYPRPDVYNALVLLRRKRKWDEKASKIEDITRCLFSEKNKRAIRVIEKCLGERIGGKLREYLEKKRIRELELKDILLLVEVSERNASNII